MEKDEILQLLYRACCLLRERCGSDVPDWVHIIANADPEMLESAAEVARDDDSLEETGEI